MSVIKVFLALVIGLALGGLGLLIILAGMVGSSLASFLVGGLLILFGLAIEIVGLRGISRA